MSPGRAALRDLGAMVVGGTFIGMIVAPTSEIVLIANGLDYGRTLTLVGLSLAVTYAIVFESGFRRQGGGRGGQGLFQRPISETVAAYASSLLVAALLLYLFGRIAPGESIAALVSRVLVLGLPTAVGGAAGRVLV